jgi:hypothetical protein
MAVFSLQEVKSLQVKDVSNNNYANWPEIGFSPLRGYLAGGSGSSSSLNSGNTCVIQRIDYSVDVSAIFPSTLSTRRARFGSWATPSYAWFQGDQTNGHSSQDRLDYSTETMSQPGRISPSNAGWGLFGTAQTPSIGYMAGGQSTAYKSGVVKFTFSTETFTFNPVGSLNVQNAGNSGVYNSSYGYFAGGYYPPQPGTLGMICAINRIQFSNETVSNITTASTKRFHINQRTFQRATTQDSTYGYWAGGQKDPPPAASFVDEIDRFKFSTEVFDPATPHSIGLGWKTMPADNNPSFAGKSAVAGASSGSHAYWVGGYDYGYTVSNIHKMDFSTGTFTNPGTLGYGVAGGVLTDGQTVTLRNRLRDTGYGTYGYWGGGTSSPGDPGSQSSIARQDFSTGSVSVIESKLPGGPFLSGAEKRKMGSMFSKNHGYFLGGDGTLTPGTNYSYSSNMHRLDFSNETMRFYYQWHAQGVHSVFGSQSSQYGYSAGGYRGSGASTTQRLDFDTDTPTTPPSLVLGYASYFGASVESSENAYFGGGYNRFGGVINQIERINFATDTADVSPMVLTGNIYNSAGASDKSYGYFGGGYHQFVGTRSQIDRVDFSTETLSPNHLNLQTPVFSHGATTDTRLYAYFGGGAYNFAVSCKIQRLDFSTGTSDLNSPDLPTVRYQTTGLAN